MQRCLLLHLSELQMEGMKFGCENYKLLGC